MAGVELRKLRVWHWNECMKAARKREDRRASRHTKEDAARAYNFHMLAVQALNDCFPPDDHVHNDLKTVKGELP